MAQYAADADREVTATDNTISFPDLRVISEQKISEGRPVVGRGRHMWSRSGQAKFKFVPTHVYLYQNNGREVKG